MRLLRLDGSPTDSNSIFENSLADFFYILYITIIILKMMSFSKESSFLSSFYD